MAQTYNPPKLDGLLQPSTIKLPLTNGGMHPSEAGPIKGKRMSRSTHERPSPVAFDGETLFLEQKVMIYFLNFIHAETQEALRKAIPRYAKIDQRPPFTYASLIRQVHSLGIEQFNNEICIRNML